MIEDSIDLHSLFAVLKRQAKIFWSVLLLVFVITLLILVAMPAKYSASTMIQVMPTAKNLLDDSDIPQNFGINNARVDGEIEILNSDAVAMQVVENGAFFDISDNDQTGRTRAIRAFQNTNSVTRKGQTYILIAEVTSSSPQRAAGLANLWAQSYINHQVAAKVGEIRRVENIVAARLLEIQTTLISSEATFDSFILQNIDILENVANIGVLRDQFGGVQRSITENSEQAQMTAANIQQADWPKLGLQISDDAFQALLVARHDLDTQILASDADDPQSAGFAQQLQEIDAQLLAKAADHLLIVENNIAVLQLQKNHVMTQIREKVLSADIPASLVTQIYALQQEATITRAEYDTLIERRRALALQADLQIADSRVISPALPPLSASLRGKKVVAASAAGLAIMIGLGLAFLNEFRISGFTSAEQLENVLMLRVGGCIPAITKPAKTKNTTDAVAQKFMSEPLSHYTESIRRLHVSMDQALARLQGDKNAGHIIVVASSVPGEGKSNTSIALGQAYALAGKKCLLIDCDLRNPKLHNLLNGQSKSSLSDVLEADISQKTIADMTFLRDKTGLKTLTGHDPALMPDGQIFTGEKFGQLVAFAKSNFDIVIFDTPPVLPVTDTVHLARFADVIALTVKWASTKQSDVKASLKILDNAKQPNTEIIAVLSQQTGAGYANNSKYYK